MRYSVALLFLAPVVGMASVIGGCSPGDCGYTATESIVGDLVTIDFSAHAEHGGLFTLSETLVTDNSGDPGFIGGAILTFWAGVYGPATASGTVGELGCGVIGTGNGGPDDHSVVNPCYNSLGWAGPITLGQIPVEMVIQLGDAGFGSSGGFHLQASFNELNFSTGEERPLAVHFLVPEPATMTLAGLGLLAVFLLRRPAPSDDGRTSSTSPEKHHPDHRSA